VSGSENDAVSGSESDAVSGSDDVTPETNEPAPPLLRIVRGDPTPEEVAALVTVLAARSGGGSAEPPPPPSAWSRPSFAHGRPLSPGPGAWWLSATDPRNRTRADW
jgi:hypothetical protein